MIRVTHHHTGANTSEILERLNRVPEMLDELGEITVSAFDELAPKDTGLLASVLTTRSPVMWTPTGDLFVGVAPLEKLGDPKKPAPKGTISAFLEWYRAERAKERKHG